MAARDSSFHEIRSRGIGGSEVAAIMGLDPNRDKFSVYADKLGLIARSAPNPRMRWGKLLEKAIAEGYSEETGFATVWCDRTMANPERPWQIYTADAWVWESLDGIGEPSGGLDAKNVSHDQAYKWGEPGTDDIPNNLALQMHWYCSAAGKPWWDVAGLFGGNDLRVFRIHRDPQIEDVCLDECWRFWNEHVLARKQPDIGCSPAAGEYLRQRFPKNTEQLRVATPDERNLLAQLKTVSQEWDRVNRECAAIENAVKETIGDSEGILDGPAKITWRRCKGTVGVDFEAMAKQAILALVTREVAATPDLNEIHRSYQRAFGDSVKRNTRIVKQGSRRLLTSWGKARTEWARE